MGMFIIVQNLVLVSKTAQFKSYAPRLFQELQGLWGKAGMKARNMVAAILKEQRAFEIDLDNSLPATKTLGVLWHAHKDIISFQVRYGYFLQLHNAGDRL